MTILLGQHFIYVTTGAANVQQISAVKGMCVFSPTALRTLRYQSAIKSQILYIKWDSVLFPPGNQAFIHYSAGTESLPSVIQARVQPAKISGAKTSKPFCAHSFTSYSTYKLRKGTYIPIFGIDSLHNQKSSGNLCFLWYLKHRLIDHDTEDSICCLRLCCSKEMATMKNPKMQQYDR